MEFAAETRVEWAEGLRHEFHELTRREQPLPARESGQWVEDSFSGQSVLEGTTRTAGMVHPPQFCYGGRVHPLRSPRGKKGLE
jgi:hypothetical protein